MKKKKKECIRRPNGFLYSLAVYCLKIYNRLFYHLTITRNDTKDMKEPFVFLSNHTSTHDFIGAALTLWPHKVNFVGGFFLFCSPVLSYLLNLVGVIPKSQFSPDISSVKKMIYCARNQRVLAIFPEGQIAPCGIASDLPPGLGKLLKTMGVPVVMNTFHGSYLSGPKWAKSSRHRHIEGECRLVLTKEQLSAMSPAEIEQRVTQELQYNDYDWQREHRIPFHKKNPAEGLETICYRCPKCGSESTMKTAGDRIFCTNCSNSGTMDALGFIHPTSCDDVVFETPYLWRKYQQECILEEVKSGSFYLSQHAVFNYAEHVGEKKQTAGDGVITLTEEGLRYEGSFFEEPHYVLTAKAATTIGLPYSAGRNFEIPFETKMIEMNPDDPTDLMKWVDGMDIVHRQALTKQKG